MALLGCRVEDVVDGLPFLEVGVQRIRGRVIGEVELPRLAVHVRLVQFAHMDEELRRLHRRLNQAGLERPDTEEAREQRVQGLDVGWVFLVTDHAATGVLVGEDLLTRFVIGKGGVTQVLSYLAEGEQSIEQLLLVLKGRFLCEAVSTDAQLCVGVYPVQQTIGLFQPTVLEEPPG